MTYYNCQRCGALLETDDQLAGHQEPCPNCRSLNEVPTGQTRQDAERPLVGGEPAIVAFLGAFLLLLGGAMAGFGMAMGTVAVFVAGVLIGVLGYVTRRYSGQARENRLRTTKQCHTCQMSVPASKAAPDWPLLAASVLATCGLWLIPAGLWLLSRRWRCDRCGHPINAVEAARYDRTIPMTAHATRAVPAVAAAQRRAAPAGNTGYDWTPRQKVAFVLFMLFGLPLLRTVCDSHGGGATPPADEPAAATALVAQDGVYGETRGTGGEYRDAMNRYFEVQPPAGWQIVEKRDKGTFTFGPESAHPGRVAPRSWIVFRNDGAEIGVIARESYSSIEEDFQLVLKGYREHFGSNVKRSRFITIDGVKGGEILASIKGMQVLLVKYKKNGLDHAITMTCPRSDFSNFAPEFEQFLRSYRSLDNTSAQTRMQGDGR